MRSRILTDEQLDAMIEHLKASLEAQAQTAKVIEGIAEPAALSAPEAQSIEAAPEPKRRRKLNRLMKEVDTAVGPSERKTRDRSLGA